jgi:hypothetical protein
MASAEGMGYPTLALSSYIQSVLYYMQAVGSLSATKGMDFNDLAGQYDNYLMDLEGEYDKGAGAYSGRGSENGTYSNELFTQFALLDFNTGNGVEAFLTPKGAIKVPKGFSESDSKIFTAGVNKALRAKKLKEKSDHYKKEVGDTKRGKLKLKAQNKHLQSFGKPLDRFSDSLKQGLKPVVAKDEIKKSEKKASTKQASYKAPVINYPSASSYNSSYGSSSSDASSSSKVKTGLSERAKNSMLVNNADKMKSELKRDDNDSLFRIVTKAYFRNLDLILERTVAAQSRAKDVKSLKFETKSEKLSKDKKSELKNLLSQ